MGTIHIVKEINPTKIEAQKFIRSNNHFKIKPYFMHTSQYNCGAFGFEKNT